MRTTWLDNRDGTTWEVAIDRTAFASRNPDGSRPTSVGRVVFKSDRHTFDVVLPPDITRVSQLPASRLEKLLDQARGG